MKQLTRKDFENLPVGSKINNGSESFKFNHIVNDIVFLINSMDAFQAFSIDLLNTGGYTINKPKQYYKGWEVRSYEGENVWVMNLDRSACYLLKEVTLDGFWGYGYKVNDTIQLTDINTTPMCDETKK